jgi:hypothetical protein
MDQNRVAKVLVTNTTGANTGTSIPTIIDGDVLVLNKAMANLTGTPTPTSAANNESIYIALGIGAGKPRLSSEIKAGQIKSWKKLAYAAPVEQISTIGYNGATEALILLDSTSYKLSISLRNERHQFRAHLKTSYDYYVTTAASADEYVTALAFIKKINADSKLAGYGGVSRMLRARFQADLISNGDFTEFATTITSILTNGSTLVTTGAAHGLVADAFVQYRGITYKVLDAPTTTTLTLDRAYTGVSETIDPDTSVDLAGVLTTVTLFGIQIQGLPITTRYSGGVPLDEYQQCTFDVSLAPVNGSLDQQQVVTETASVVGQGFAEQVIDMEVHAMGWLGVTNRTLFPIDSFTPRAIKGNQYTLYVIEHYDTIDTGQQVLSNPMLTVIAFKSDVTTKMDAIEAILDSWMVGAGLPAV